MKLSQRIRAMREDHDLTQTDIAKLLNTSQTVYSRYERDERTLPTEMLYTLALYYNISADYLLGLTAESAEIKFNARVRISLLTALGRYCIIN